LKGKKMNGILGKITEVKKKSSGKRDGFISIDVSFKPVCVMPNRNRIPEWLKDQTLKVTRKVADLREIGGIGDSIVCSPAESEPWLFPLSVEPLVVYDNVPKKIELTLRWWKNKKPGEYTVMANGRRQTGKFVKKDKKSDGFSASIDTKGFFDKEPTLPVDLNVSFDKLTLTCTVLPSDCPCHHKLKILTGERHRIEGNWYSVDICASEKGGGITMLREKGRDLDHFKSDDSTIRSTFDHACHYDGASIGWGDQLGGVAMTGVSTRRDGQTSRLSLDGVLDEGQNIRTSVAFTVFDEFPIVTVQRDILRGKAGKKDDKKEEEKPKEPIDDMVRMALSFRAHYQVEKDERPSCRTIAIDEDRLASIRGATDFDGLPFWRGWKAKHGWAIMENTFRKQYLLALADPSNPPRLSSMMWTKVMAFEYLWPPLPISPESGTGFAVSMTAGELCGASHEGAWVACRRVIEGGIECAVVGRFEGAVENKTAVFKVGRRNEEIPLRQIFLPGIGELYVASAQFQKATMNGKFDVVAGAVPARRAR